MKKLLPFILFCLAGFESCKYKEPKPEVKVASEKTYLPSEYYHFVDKVPHLKHRETVYIPVYSNIYVISGERMQSLTATVSVRNTSQTDTMYVLNVDYYDSQGNLVKQYSKKPIRLNPLQSIEFIVENKESKGGVGANFIINWGTKSEDLKPILQAVMIGQHGVTFLTEGVATKISR
jgi:hypothetical protein